MSLSVETKLSLQEILENVKKNYLNMEYIPRDNEIVNFNDVKTVNDLKEQKMDDVLKKIPKTDDNDIDTKNQINAIEELILSNQRMKKNSETRRKNL